MPANNTYSGGLPSSRRSQSPVQEEYQWTRDRPPQHNHGNVPSGRAAGFSNQPADDLAQELDTMYVSGVRHDGATFQPPMGCSSPAHASNSYLAPSYPASYSHHRRRDVGIAVLTQAQDPCNFPLTSEALRVHDIAQGDDIIQYEHYLNQYSDWFTDSYGPPNDGHPSVPAGQPAAADLSDSMRIPRRTHSRTTDADWVVVPTAPETKLSRINEDIYGAGAGFNGDPAPATGDEIVMCDYVYEYDTPATTYQRQ
ncbi:hypothetical protein PGQ11_005442 [Apiospora arundinis]|uniref:Uncharacterized protein n=1 Tax=Apiospora arundinis TaxID=335852 RepID=A0ABR2JBK5_9PEZI